jgi:hypothetical protein
MAVQIAVIDDWQNIASRVADWSALDSIGDGSMTFRLGPQDSRSAC